MKQQLKLTILSAATMALLGLIVVSSAEPLAQGSNPDVVKSEINPKLVLRPKGTKLFDGNKAQLIKQGEALFKDQKLSTNGSSCQTCHAENEGFSSTFASAYPHEVTMAKEKAGTSEVQLDEMIQFCMVVPMEAKPLPWNSRDLAALTAYAGELQKAFRKRLQPNDARAGNSSAPK